MFVCHVSLSYNVAVLGCLQSYLKVFLIFSSRAMIKNCNSTLARTAFVSTSNQLVFVCLALIAVSITTVVSIPQFLKAFIHVFLLIRLIIFPYYLFN